MATFNLTKNADTGAAFKGTTGNDVYNAAAVGTALLPVQTLNNNDKFDAGDGRDTLNLQLVNAVTAPQKLLNLEILKFTGAPGIASIAPALLDLSGANAVDSLVFNGMSGSLVPAPYDVAITNVSSVLKNVTIRNDVPFLGGIQYAVQLTGAATDGAADKLTINLQRANSGLQVQSDSAAATAGYENVAIKSTGGIANNFQLDSFGQGPDRITVSGTQDLNLGGDVLNFGTLAKFQAGTFTGDLNVRFTGTSVAGSLVKGGSGMDAIDLNGTGGAVTIKSAAGVDAVTLSGAHVGDLTVDLGSGDATIGNESFNTQGNGITGNLLVTGGDEGNSITVDSVTGNVGVKTGAAADSIEVASAGDTIVGNVEVDAGEGDNAVRIGAVTGTIAAMAGAGADSFVFTNNGGPNSSHSFGAGDTVEGGLGVDTAEFQVDSNLNVAFMANGTGTISGIETVRHTGTIDTAVTLTVDMDTLGSAHRLELNGAYTNGASVAVINSDFGLGDTVAAVHDITGTLSVDRALVTAPAFNVEIGDVTNAVAGTEINALDVGTGSDLVNIKSVGATTADRNLISDASAIDAASVAITGDHDISIGGEATTTGLAGVYGLDTAYDAAGTVIDASGLNANLVLYVDNSNGAFTIIGSNGAGSDQIWLTEGDVTSGNTATVVMGAGAGSDIVGFADEQNTSETADFTHLIQNFDVNNDLVAFSLGNVSNSIASTDGTLVAAGDAGSTRNVLNGEIVNLSGGDFNFIKLTANNVTGGVTEDADALYDAAIGAGVITVAANTGGLIGAAYDSVSGEAVLFNIHNGADTTVDAGNHVDVYGRFEMSYSDYLNNFDASDFLFTV